MRRLSSWFGLFLIGTAVYRTRRKMRTALPVTRGRFRHCAAKQPNEDRALRCAQSTPILAISNNMLLNSVSSAPL